MTKNDQSRHHRSVLLNQLHIYGLVGLAVAYPIYSFFLTNPAYLTINGVTSNHLCLMIGLLSFGLPLSLVALDLVLRLLPEKIYSVFHYLLIAPIIGLCVLPVASRFERLSLWLILGIAAVLTAIVIWQLLTNRLSYVFLGILGPFALLFPLQFSFDHSISQILNPKSTEDFQWEAKENERLPTVVMIVFDEFPLVHLLDAQGNIDKKRFPNFAALGESATWYSNATTVHDQTMKAVPSILTGRYPVAGLIVPIPENYPGSLFNIMRSHYRIHASEPVTRLSETYEDGFEVDGVDTRMLAGDIAIFYARSLLPVRVSDDWLPLEEGIWGGFLGRMPEQRQEESRDALGEWLGDNNQWRVGSRKSANRYRQSLQYADEMASYPRNTFHYLHLMIPHRPYGFLPTGRQYFFSYNSDIEHVDAIRLEREAHILQVGLADTILGNIRSGLEKSGQWEDSMVVVLADHGEAYRPEENNRLITPKNIGEVGFVPLLIKYPGQQEGSVDDTNVQTIDIAPTILDVLGIQNGPLMEGRSLIDENASIPETKKIMSESGTTYSIPEQAYQQSRAFAHRSAVKFFSLNEPRSDLFNYGPGLAYLGVQLAKLRSFRSPYQLGVYDLKQYQHIDFDAPEIPVLIQGKVLDAPELDPKDFVVAISINGVVRAVTTPFRSTKGELYFHKVLSEGALGETNDVLVVLLPTTKR